MRGNQSRSRRLGRQRHPPPCSGDCVLSAGLLRSRDRWQPQQSQVHHGSDGPGYLDRTPTCTGPLSGPFRVRIEAWQRWGGVGQSFPEDLVRSKSRMFCDRNEKMMMENARTVRRSVDAQEEDRERKRAKTTPLRNEAQLNCVALRSQLDCEMTCGAVKGQEERRPSAAPLTAPQVIIGRRMLTSENKLRRAATSALTF